jgi:hypothetical protein
MGQGPPVSLRLITANNETIEHYCRLCLFLHDSEECEYNHKRPFNASYSRPSSRQSDTSRYSERTVDDFAFFGSTRELRVKIVTTPPKTAPALRRRISPTDVSLRELSRKQSQQGFIQRLRSEERLQRVYEDQILAYLGSPLAEKGIL